MKVTANVEVVFNPQMRGLARADFVDANGEECSLQESSLAGDEPHIWLGCNKNAPIHHLTLEPMSPRMHLSQSHVRELLPYLMRFAQEGVLIDGK